MKRIFLLLVILCPLLLSAQVSITLLGGISNYQGDLQEKRFTTAQSHGAAGLGLQYDFNPWIALRAGALYAKVSGDDKTATDPLLLARNLNFTSKILEGNLLLELRLLDIDRHRFTPYVFGGIAVFGFDPYTNDSTGTRYYLQPYTTEGVAYQRTRLAFPFGGGIKFKVSDRVLLGYEIGLRKTNTDYLDDVSNRYIDHDVLLAAKGAKAVELAYRGGELKGGNPVYPAAGTKRGGSEFNDWYYIQGITLTYRIGQLPFGKGNKTGRSRDGSELACPKNVY
ncbi:MAG: DUF6089 family protein [Flavihumibacter sp.]